MKFLKKFNMLDNINLNEAQQNFLNNTNSIKQWISNAPNLGQTFYCCYHSLQDHKNWNIFTHNIHNVENELNDILLKSDTSYERAINVWNNNDYYHFKIGFKHVYIVNYKSLKEKFIDSPSMNLCFDDFHLNFLDIKKHFKITQNMNIVFCSKTNTNLNI